jgi:hypothetical protein
MHNKSVFEWCSFQPCATHLDAVKVRPPVDLLRGTGDFKLGYSSMLLLNCHGANNAREPVHAPLAPLWRIPWNYPVRADTLIMARL